MSELSNSTGYIGPTPEYLKAVIKANRQLAEHNITRVDFRHERDGLRRFRKWLDGMEKRWQI